ncbi:unnamed protein product [Musa hybrid cultivar]
MEFTRSLPRSKYPLFRLRNMFKSGFFVIGIGEFLWIHPPKESDMIIFHHPARARMKGMAKIDPYKIYFSYISPRIIYNDSM